MNGNMPRQRTRRPDGKELPAEPKSFRTLIREVSMHDDENKAYAESTRNLRYVYGSVTLFWSGFLAVLCVQLFLYIFLDLSIHLAINSEHHARRPKYLTAFGVSLSILPLTHGLASLMVLAGSYVSDAYRGHPFTRKIAFRGAPRILVDWLHFALFTIIPLVSMAVSLLTANDDFWEVTGLIWFGISLLFFLIFAGAVIRFEIFACLQVMRNHGRHNHPGILMNTCKDHVDLSHTLHDVVYLRQLATYSGYRTVTTTNLSSFGKDFLDKGANIQQRDRFQVNQRETASAHCLATCWSLWKWLGWYEFPEEIKEVPMLNINGSVGDRGFITRTSFSLEALVCDPSQDGYVAIITGDHKLMDVQQYSTLIAFIVSPLMVLLLAFSLLWYLRVQTEVIVAVVVLCFWRALPSALQTVRAYNFLQTKKAVLEMNSLDLNGDGVVDEKEARLGNMAREGSIGVYLEKTRYRVSQPTRRFAIFCFYMEITFFFFIPLTALFSVGNWRMALVFLIVAGVSGIRYYISLKALLEEAGLLDLVYNRQATESRRRSSFLHAMSDFQHYAHGRSRGAWYTILTLFALVFLFLAAGALLDGQENVADGFNTPFTYVQEFAYHQQDALAYPTCEITSDFGDSILQNMADYAFMAGHGYRGSSISQIELDRFFGGLVTDRIDVVEKYHQERGISSRVSIKLLTASAGLGKKDFAYVVIRGTENNWDLLTDAQLWAPAILMQVLRIIMPFGDVWTPIMPPLIKAIASVESDAVDQISFYRDTVEFTNWIKNRNDYSGVAITGHSLGGGLSIITGAITETLAVALSGPNAKLSRLSFQPEISIENLDRFSFNIVPERDLVPMFDDKAQNFQMIRCNADYSDLAGCHDPTRSLCEIMHTCGSENRPVLCECVEKYGYEDPLPIRKGEKRSFAKACEDARTRRHAILKRLNPFLVSE